MASTIRYLPMRSGTPLTGETPGGRGARPVCRPDAKGPCLPRAAGGEEPPACPQAYRRRGASAAGGRDRPDLVGDELLDGLQDGLGRGSVGGLLESLLDGRQVELIGRIRDG